MICTLVDKTIITDELNYETRTRTHKIDLIKAAAVTLAIILSTYSVAVHVYHEELVPSIA
jgi:hypothetical protein